MNSGNKYKYALIDNSYILARNHYGISVGKKAGEYTVGDLIKSCIYTLNKIPRDFGVTADKYVFICDKWSPDFGESVFFELGDNKFWLDTAYGI